VRPLPLLAVAVSLVLWATACTRADRGELRGRYGGERCLYDMDFRAGGLVYVNTLGMEHAGSYVIDGERVAVTMPNTAGIVFTRRGDTLRAMLLGEQVLCVRR
jgi:hypothetical protein